MNNQTKRKELVLFIARRCVTHQLFGKIKLNKILFFSDMNAYTRLGTSITGFEYEKREFGPVPRTIDGLIESMCADGSATVVSRDMPNFTAQKRVTPLREPDLSDFTAQEIALVDEVIEWMRPMTAKEISELSHQAVGWEVARMGETIPYSTALIPLHPIPLTEKEKARAMALAQSLAGTGAN